MWWYVLKVGLLVQHNNVRKVGLLLDKLGLILHNDEVQIITYVPCNSWNGSLRLDVQVGECQEKF